MLELYVEQFERDGFAVAHGLLSPEEAQNVRETFMTQAQNGPVPGLSESHYTFAEGDPLARYPRMMHPHRHDNKIVGPLSRRYLLDARIASVLRELLGEEPVAAQSMFYFKPPGARGQDLHQDNFYLRVAPGTCIAAWVAVDDADRENGGMVLVPGTGDMEVACPAEADDSKFFTKHHVAPPPGKAPVGVDLKAGDVLFFNGSVIHGSYPNESADRFRRSLIFHYVPQSCAEVAKGYRPLLNMDGEEVLREDAQGGGPCGAPIPNTLH